jgi:TM2 domain-containing membrane protein YozV
MFLEEIEKLADLKERGILTETEFQEKKRQILASDASKPGHGAAALPASDVAALDVSNKILVEQRVAHEAPSQGLAYVLWFFTAILGGHRFYLGKIGSGVGMLLLSITIVGLVVSIPWAIIDLFLIPAMCREKTAAIRWRIQQGFA